MHTLSALAHGWTLRLLLVSLQGAVLAGIVWLLCRAIPSLSAAVRSRLWWLVCAQVLLGLLWPDAMKLHLLHRSPVTASAVSLPWQASAAGIEEGDQQTTAAISVSAPQLERLPTLIPARELPGWPIALFLAWAAGALVSLLLLVREHRMVTDRLHCSHPADDGLRQLLAQQALSVGLTHIPELRVAPEIRSPQVVGLLQPTVLLPEEGLSAWIHGDLVLALRHECLHLRHHDLWWGWVPALAQRLFFFNPVAAFAAREFALTREAAVDEALLSQPDVSARHYGELLLKLGVSVSGTTSMATASPSFRILHRRLTMMNARSARGRVASIAGMLALLLVAGASLPLSATPTPASATPALAEVPPMAAVAPPALPPSPAVPAPPPLPPTARSGKHSHNHTYIYDDGKNGTSIDIDGPDDHNKETRIVLSDGGKQTQIFKIREGADGHSSHIWYHDGDKGYVVSDDQTTAKVFALLQPMKQFGEQQGKLGEQQGLLGGKQAELGAEQARLADEQARLASEMAKAQSHDEAGKAVDDFRRQQDEIGKQQDELGRRQDELGRRQDELGRRQDELGHRQDELGKQQDQAAHDVVEQLRGLMKQAISNGLAKPA